MITWIDIEFALAIHERQLAEHGGDEGVRDMALLDAALAKPKQLQAYGDPPPDLAELASALAVGIAKYHPFIDGNKRTAAVACESFIILNGGEFVATDEEAYWLFYNVAAGTLTEAECCEFLRSKIVVDRENSVQERAVAYG